MSYAGTYGPSETCKHDRYGRNCGACEHERGRVRYDSELPARLAHPAEAHAVATPDAQTETPCGRCGGPCGDHWSAPSPLWNYVMRGDDINNEYQSELVCPPCFIAAAEERFGRSLHWRLDAVGVDDLLTYVTPSGRVWNSETWLWDDANPDPRTRRESDVTTPGGNAMGAKALGSAADITPAASPDVKTDTRTTTRRRVAAAGRGYAVERVTETVEVIGTCAEFAEAMGVVRRLTPGANDWPDVFADEGE